LAPWHPQAAATVPVRVPARVKVVVVAAAADPQGIMGTATTRTETETTIEGIVLPSPTTINITKPKRRILVLHEDTAVLPN